MKFEEAKAASFLYDGYASDQLNGWLNDACVGGGKTLYPGLKDARLPCDLELVESLVAAGACMGGAKALHTAAANDHGDCVRLLVALGADVGVADEHGNTALHIAATVTALAAVRALLAGGARARAANHRGATPRDAAVAERAMADDWCAKLDIALDSPDDARDAENHPRVLRLLEEVAAREGPAPEPCALCDDAVLLRIATPRADAKAAAPPEAKAGSKAEVPPEAKAGSK